MVMAGAGAEGDALAAPIVAPADADADADANAEAGAAGGDFGVAAAAPEACSPEPDSAWLEQRSAAHGAALRGEALERSAAFAARCLGLAGAGGRGPWDAPPSLEAPAARAAARAVALILAEDGEVGGGKAGEGMGERARTESEPAAGLGLRRQPLLL